MKDDSSIRAIQERMLEAGELLRKLGEEPDAIGELRAALDAEDLERFRSALERGLGGFAPPPDKCDPYVRVVIATVKPPKYVRRCAWVYQGLEPAEGERLAEAVATGISAERLSAVLEALGLIRCTWERESQDEVLVLDKFVQGMCPPGTF
jgi:hypothetical protein